MANEVFANGLEIACKRADGESVACFPDPCWTPGWSVIAYANTAYAKDTENASKTVYISNKPIMKKDISYFKTSTGNEPCAGKKGFITGARKGKAYFRSWSMNVKIEGKNVCRHTDMVTHNHNPAVGNTGTWMYIDTANDKDCKKDFDRVEKACTPSEKEQKKFKRKQQKANAKRKPDKRKPYRKKTWKDNSCKGMLVKPSIGSLTANAKDLQAQADNMIDNIKGELLERGFDMVGEAGKNLAIRTGVKHTAALGCAVFAGIGAIVCEIVAGVTTAVDAVYSTIDTGIDIYQNSSRLLSTMEALEGQLKNSKEFLSSLSKEGLTKEQLEALKKKKQEIVKEMQEGMSDTVLKDKCLSARKCMLAPYTGKQGDLAKGEVEKGKGPDFLSDKFGLGDSRGCCPGQTGHHLVPDSWVKDKCGGPGKYSKGSAPVVCMEGTSHTGGTHGDIHIGLNKKYNEELNSRLKGKKGNTIMAMDKVLDMATASHNEVYPIDWPGLNWSNGCNPKCLKKQLNNYYKDKGCNGIKPDTIGSNNENGTGGR